MAISNVSHQTLVIQQDGAVAHVRLAGRDGERIYLLPDRLKALTDAFAALADRSDIAVVVLSGGTREFCLGADASLLRGAGPAEAAAYLELGMTALEAVRRFRQPVIAAVGGLALGGGFELALACDLRWAHRKAAFGLPEAALNLVPAWGGVTALAHDLPGGAAWELLTGQRIGAQRAYELGLIGRIFDGTDFAARSMEAARQLAVIEPATLAALKTLWQAGRPEHRPSSGPELCLDRLFPDRRHA